MYTWQVPPTSCSSTSLLRAAGVILLAVTQASPVPAQAVPWATTPASAIDSTTLPEDRGAAGLAQTLNKLHTWASLMMIVAHPDDEDGGMMAYESRGVGARTTLMTLTRGEGGQNAVSGESYDALGLIRTNELLAADRYTGTEQIWGTEADYGFSKTKDEAFAQWTHDRVLRDVVRAVREQRPLVLASVFIGGITDGHGHHQVSGQLTQEAFNASGNPNMFPDQIAAGLRPWKPMAVYARTPFAPITAKGMYDYATDTWAPPAFTNYVTGEKTAVPPVPEVTIQEGMYDPVLGRSYLQMAREGLGLQKSQLGGGDPPLAGPSSVTYHRYGSRVAGGGGSSLANGDGFFSGVDTSLPGMVLLAHGGDTAFVTEGLQKINRAVLHALAVYTPAEPMRIAPNLVEAYKSTQSLLAAVQASSLTPDSKADLQHELGIKLVQCNTALVQVLGLHMDALVMPTPAQNGSSGTARALTLTPALSRTHVTPGETFEVRLHVSSAVPWASGGAGLTLASTGLDTSKAAALTLKDQASSGQQDDTHAGVWDVSRIETADGATAPSSVTDVIFRVNVPLNAAPTEPYFHRPSIEQPYYDLADPKLSGQSMTPYPVSAFADFNYNGVPLHLAEVVQGEQREPGRGNFATPLVVTRRLSVMMPRHIAVLPIGQRELTVEATVTNEETEPAAVDFQLTVPDGWTAVPVEHPHLAAGECATVQFKVQLPPDGVKAGADTKLTAIAGSGLHGYGRGQKTAGYPGLRPTNFGEAATLDVRQVDVHVTPGVRVGYVMGTGDEVPAALRAIGVPVDLLSAADLGTADLRAYSTIMLGVRTYTAQPSLAQAQTALEQFARAGGTVVLQYQSGDFPGVPFALHLGTVPARVVDEHSAVTFSAPNDPLLTVPNRITAADFDGWLEERGHGFAGSWGPEWTPLLATADPGQVPQQGGLLVAPLGRGHYVYAALALYRQLPEGVPGAYRLLANLVSYGVPERR